MFASEQNKEKRRHDHMLFDLIPEKLSLTDLDLAHL